jgi:uncharacterized protein (DUF302 family)/uncharacterized membrane protein YidH (DUF202 family)
MSTTIERRASVSSDFLAAERTFLGWIRTGLALMGFGFVVARFGLFVQELQFAYPDLPVRGPSRSLPLGTALVILGVIVTLGSAWNHVRLMQESKREGEAVDRTSTLGIVVALALAGVGVAMAVTLFAYGEPTQLHTETRGSKPMKSDSGIVKVSSRHSVDDTVAKLEGLLQAKGVKLFAVIDHSGEAKMAGLEMPNTKLLIFGSPKAGTPLMLASPSIAIDLPLKLLVSEDTDRRVWIYYSAPTYLQVRHGLPQELVSVLAAVETLATQAGG